MTVNRPSDIPSDTMSAKQHERDETDDPRIIDAKIFDLVRSVPAGRVASYGQVGAACDPPISGYICGRILRRGGGDLPWWRIVGKDGNMPVKKVSPEHGDEQRDTLKNEGVKFLEDGRVNMARFAWDFGPRPEEAGSEEPG